MPDRTSYHSLLDAVERYFDLMFDSEVSRFDQVFASSAQLHGLRDQNLFDLCAAGISPAGHRERSSGAAGLLPDREADGRFRHRHPGRATSRGRQPGQVDRVGFQAGTAMSPSTVPDAVYTIWWAGLIVTLVVFVPLAVYLLHRTWRSARSIQRYAAETLQAAGGIARNTSNIVALDATIGVAGDMLVAAGAAERKLDTVATVLEERSQ
jgi:hypothetical protein